MKSKFLIFFGAAFNGLVITRFLGEHRDCGTTIADVFKLGQIDEDTVQEVFRIGSTDEIKIDKLTRTVG